MYRALLKAKIFVRLSDARDAMRELFGDEYPQYLEMTREFVKANRIADDRDIIQTVVRLMKAEHSTDSEGMRPEMMFALLAEEMEL